MEQRSKTEFFEGQDSDPWKKPRDIYKYSEYIHRDRHIFLGRAMFYDENVMETPPLVPQETRLPSLKRVQLYLNVVHNEPKYRFSESLNTYVHTRKRMQVVHSVDESDKRASMLMLPSINNKNLLGGVLKTTPLRRPCVTKKTQERPPFQTEQTFWNTQTESFQTGVGTDTTHLMSCMPTRFRCALKHSPLWRQKTDSLLINQRNYKVRF